MATIYEVMVVSDYINYPKEELENYLTEIINEVEHEKGNTIRFQVLKKD